MSDYLWYIHYLCVYALQARNFKEERGITLALWKSFYVMLERIVEIYIIYIEEWNMSNCIKEQKICQILYILFIIWLKYTPVNGVLHCILRFIFMFEKKISLTSLFESEFDFQSRVPYSIINFLLENISIQNLIIVIMMMFYCELYEKIIFKRSNISY